MHRATGAGAAISLSLAGPSTRQVLGANDRVRVGAIGTGRQALSNIKAFQKHGAEVVAVCDVYEPNLAKGKAQAGDGAASHKDFRRVLDDKTIDMVIVATPDHWHALPMLMACQAGKDVFVEKPVAVAVEEGKAMLAAARQHQRVVQVGLWQRSNAHFQQAVQVVRSGLLGKVTYVRAWNYSNSSPIGIGNAKDTDPPAELDWDMWLGPAPKVPFNANRFGVRDDRWSTFRYFWDYSNGILGDWASTTSTSSSGRSRTSRARPRCAWTRSTTGSRTTRPTCSSACGRASARPATSRTACARRRPACSAW